LVLIPENRPRNTGEPSGEPESLVGRIKYRFGDRAVPSESKFFLSEGERVHITSNEWKVIGLI
jgi:hypothetical protein